MSDRARSCVLADAICGGRSPFWRGEGTVQYGLCSRGVFLAQSEFFSRFPTISMIDEAVCGRLRAFEPRTAHEHALLAQLPEFYSREPSRSNLRSIAERVLSSTEEENRSLGRGVIQRLCPTVTPFVEERNGNMAVAAIIMAVIACICVCFLVRPGRSRH